MFYKKKIIKKINYVHTQGKKKFFSPTKKQKG